MLRALHAFRFPRDALILSSSGPVVTEEMIHFLERITAEARSRMRQGSAGEKILAAPSSAESERETTHQRPFVGRNDCERPHTQAHTAILIYYPGNNHPTVYSLRQIQYLCPEARSNLVSVFSVPVVVNFSNWLEGRWLKLVFLFVCVCVCINLFADIPFFYQLCNFKNTCSQV